MFVPDNCMARKENNLCQKNSPLHVALDDVIISILLQTLDRAAAYAPRMSAWGNLMSP